MSCFLGIDLGGTNTVAALVDTGGVLLAKESISTDVSSPDAICDGIARVVASLTEKMGVLPGEILRVGVGTPGIVCGDVVVYASNLGFDDTPLAAMLEARLHLPVRLQNDGNAAAYGEFAAGAGKGKSSLVALTIGTGIGGGIIVDGKILSGFNGAAGELGHTVIAAGGRCCSCGKAGCLEAYCSATSLKAITRAAMEAAPSSLLWNFCGGDSGRVSAKTPFEAMRQGDATATQIVENFLYHLSLGVSNAINLLQPQVFCIGGGVSKEGDAILLPLRELVRQQTYLKNEEQRTHICTALLGNDAGLIGAALME